MDLDLIKKGIQVKVYHIKPGMVVPLHSHEASDEVFYCIKGSGFGVSADGEVELNVGDTFVAGAGSLHSLRTEGDMYVTAFLIPAEKIVCRCKQVSFGDIKKAMAAGARSVEDIKEMTGAGTGCGGCIGEIEEILAVACGCKGVSMKDAAEAVRNGADTLEKLEAATGAGSVCGMCKKLLQNVVDTKR